jgi:hypothetical protein
MNVTRSHKNHDACVRETLVSGKSDIEENYICCSCSLVLPIPFDSVLASISTRLCARLMEKPLQSWTEVPEYTLQARMEEVADKRSEAVICHYFWRVKSPTEKIRF